MLLDLTDRIYHGVRFALMCVYEWPVDYSAGMESGQFTPVERDRPGELKCCPRGTELVAG